MVANAIKQEPLREFRSSWTERCAGVRMARPASGYEMARQDESKKALQDSSAAVNR